MGFDHKTMDYPFTLYVRDLNDRDNILARHEFDTKEDLAFFLRETSSQKGQFYDLRNVDLTDADLTRCSIRHADFRDADLSGAKFDHSFLGHVNFSRSKLEATKFQAAMLGNTDFSDTLMKGVRIIDCNCDRTRFSRADMRYATIGHETMLRQCDFTGADLTGASFDNVLGAISGRFDEARMTGAEFINLPGEKPVNVSAASFNRVSGRKLRMPDVLAEDTDFNDADLSESDFSGSRVNKSRFENSNLVRADFARAAAEHTHFKGAKTNGMKIEGSDLFAARIDTDQLKQAEGTPETGVLDKGVFARRMKKLRPLPKAA